MLAETEYQQALDYLYGFVNYERKMTETYAPEKMDPTRPARILALLADPQSAFASIHIAGSKGKGSVAAMCASVLRAAGLKVGLFTSPHLQDFRERIRILSLADADGKISPGEFAILVQRLKAVEPAVPGVTWFELVTAIAFMHFAQQEVDVAVIEVGLGGRLDATNVLLPLVTVITRLSLEHTNLLGDTVELIAAEKGGIIKSGVPVVSAPQAAGALTVLRKLAAAKGAPLTVVGDAWRHIGSAIEAGQAQRLQITRSQRPACVPVGSSFDIPLAGRFQQENALVAIAAICNAAGPRLSVSLDAMRRGLGNVRWPGRMQTLLQQPHAPQIIVDSAHNPDSIAHLIEALQTDFAYERLWLVAGFTLDKDVRGMLQILLPRTPRLFVSQANHPRAAPVAMVADTAAELGYEVTTNPTVEEALLAAYQGAEPTDLICVCGSIFVAGDLLNRWDALQSEFLPLVA